VCGRPDLVDDAAPPTGTELEELVVSGEVVGAVARSGDVLVRFPSGGTDRPDLVEKVHRAVVAALAMGQWTVSAAVTQVALGGGAARQGG
jgi:hypothetical protein